MIAFLTPSLALAAPAVTAAFASSLVEVVEAFTIVLAVSTVRGWKPAAIGTVLGLLALAALTGVFGPLLARVPLRIFHLAIGFLLLGLGLKWLRKAVLRAAGRMALHDEERIFVAEQESLRRLTPVAGHHADKPAIMTAFQAVLVEGVEVVMIVLAVGAGHGLLVPAAIGAAAACVLVLAAGIWLHRPLARVPENTLKFGVGVMLAAFGIAWGGEGLGLRWPGGDLALIYLAAAVLLLAGATVFLLRKKTISPDRKTP